jgi:hypothetical protein
MNRIRVPASLAIFTLILTMGVGGQLVAQMESQPPISLSLSDVHLNHQSLSFVWHLVNRSSEPLYVYSTFLYGPAAATATTQAGLLCVRTSLSHAESVGVNAYPPAEFLRIEPGSALDGKFVDRHLGYSTAMDVRALQVEVGFGSEIEELKHQIALTSRNGNHPANPIVAWQTEVFGTSPIRR